MVHSCHLYYFSPPCDKRKDGVSNDLQCEYRGVKAGQQEHEVPGHTGSVVRKEQRWVLVLTSLFPPTVFLRDPTHGLAPSARTSAELTHV